MAHRGQLPFSVPCLNQLQSDKLREVSQLELVMIRRSRSKLAQGGFLIAAELGAQSSVSGSAGHLNYTAELQPPTLSANEGRTYAQPGNASIRPGVMLRERRRALAQAEGCWARASPGGQSVGERLMGGTHLFPGHRRPRRCTA